MFPNKNLFLLASFFFMADIFQKKCFFLFVSYTHTYFILDVDNIKLFINIIVSGKKNLFTELDNAFYVNTL